MPLTIPNRPAATFLPQAKLFQADIDAIVLGESNEGVIAGCLVSAQGAPNMTVAVAAGLITVGGYFPFVAASNVTITTANGANPRLDLIVCDWNGVLSAVAGTPAAQPMMPAIPTNNIPLAAVYVPAGATAILSTYIIDKRVIVSAPYTEFDDMISGQITTTGSVGKLGWSRTAAGTAGDAWQDSVANRPGIFRMQSGTTSGNNSRLTLGTNATRALIDPTHLRRLCWNVRIPDITTVSVRVGAGQDISSATFGTAGVWWEYDSAANANWRAFTRQGGTSNPSPVVGNAAVNNNWVWLCLHRLQNGNWQAAINDVLIGTLSANLPTTLVNIGALVQTGAAAARSLDIDLFAMNYVTGQRWT